MALRPPHGCATPGCPALVRRGARCPEHDRALRAEMDSTRGSPSRRGYDATWRRIRDAFLRRHPLCEMECAARGLKVPATQVDHKLPLARGGTHDPRNLQAACASCHSRKTVREDGRFGRRARRSA